MRKTTEELANAAVSELKDSQFDFNDLDAADKQILFQWFETFRRLVIENERECAEEIGYIHPMDVGRFLNLTTERISEEQLAVFVSFPPAAIDRDGVIEECAKVVEQIQDDDPSDGINGWTAARCIRRLKSQPAAPDPRDEALRIARAALDELSKLGNGKLVGNSVGNVLASEALAAIDKVIGEK